MDNTQKQIVRTVTGLALGVVSIPVGVQLNKAGNCVFFSLMTMLMMSIYGIELTPQLFATLLVSVCIMSIAKPPVPCGGIICMAYLLSMVGVPAEAISVVVCIDPLAAMFNGVYVRSCQRWQLLLPPAAVVPLPHRCVYRSLTMVWDAASLSVPSPVDR